MKSQRVDIFHQTAESVLQITPREKWKKKIYHAIRTSSQSGGALQYMLCRNSDSGGPPLGRMGQGPRG